MSDPDRPRTPVAGRAATALLDHLAFGVPVVAAVTPLLVGTLGGAPRGAGAGTGFRFWQWEFAGGGALEILEPDGPPDGFLHRFLTQRGGPGPHHLTFKVPNIHAAMDRAKTQGRRVVGFDDTFPAWIEAFLHPKTAQGIVVQIVEAHPELESDAPTLAGYPPAPAPATPPARLLGVRLCAHSETDALRQWGELLGGRCEADARGLRFHWPDSPLRVAVTIDPARPEGPLCTEWQAARDLGLPAGPHPVLGLPLSQVAD